jgi:spore cortex biosynthesis protein YabQ
MDAISAQLFAIFITILSGFLLGLFFDLYRVLRALWRPGPLWTRVGDLLFWLFALCLLFSLLLLGNWGQMRLYVVLGWALGLLIYNRLLSRKIIAICFTLFSATHHSFVQLGRGFYLFWAAICRRLHRK